MFLPFLGSAVAHIRPGSDGGKGDISPNFIRPYFLIKITIVVSEKLWLTGCIREKALNKYGIKVEGSRHFHKYIKIKGKFKIFQIITSCRQTGLKPECLGFF